jgi:hypothetical protein
MTETKTSQDKLLSLMNHDLIIIESDEKTKRRTRLNIRQMKILLDINEVFKNQINPMIIYGKFYNDIVILSLLPFLLNAKQLIIFSPSYYKSKKIIHPFGDYPLYQYEKNLSTISHFVNFRFYEDNYLPIPYIISRKDQSHLISVTDFVVLDVSKFFGNINSSPFASDDITLDKFQHFDTFIVWDAHLQSPDTLKILNEKFKDKRKIYFTKSLLNNGKQMNNCNDILINTNNYM